MRKTSQISPTWFNDNSFFVVSVFGLQSEKSTLVHSALYGKFLRQNRSTVWVLLNGHCFVTGKDEAWVISYFSIPLKFSSPTDSFTQQSMVIQKMNTIVGYRNSKCICSWVIFFSFSSFLGTFGLTMVYLEPSRTSAKNVLCHAKKTPS